MLLAADATPTSTGLNPAPMTGPDVSIKCESYR
jgi:hypothetical protein